ncbi:MAG TPA: hypothetical protein VIM12_05325 [Noviherbaspirillum sp.]|jgi:hypothetical protein|uniref:hypothetical protein n=1 Tax=Noviherbaspirillum sp. TaxID=1926288 RepID=UPI002F91C7C9
MHSLLIARIFLLLVVFTLAVPESYAKRAGSGRSSGRQSSAVRQPPAPPRTAPAPTPAQPPVSAQPAPANAPLPPAPQHTLPREAGSPWGGMLGGALLGLGLGSLISGDRQADTVTQSEGSSGNAGGSSASGAGESTIPAQQANEPVPQNKLGPGLLLAVFALIVFIAARRLRTRRR